ncbi:MAG: hypothetical protein WAV25_01345 [Minisyncoccia bacterium]
MTLSILKVIIPPVLTFFIGVAITPIFTKYFYKYKMWKKSPRSESDTIKDFADIHNTKSEVSTPRVGGIIIWMSVLLAVFGIYLLSIIWPTDITTKLSYLSREQTLIPLATLIFGALLGLFDDALQILGKGDYAKDNPAYRKIKILLITLIGTAIGFWFYNKLGMSTVHFPFWKDIDLGLWFIPFFVVVMLATFSTSVIDGIDGLAGGVLASIFGAFAVIAFVHHQIDISAFCGALTGAILAFLWFNIPPARFYMGETGMLGLTITLSVIAFLTNSALILPIIAIPLVATSFSVIVQIISYKFRNGKRVFRLAPLHHHFQAIGWSREKIVMRYWVISIVFAAVGVVIALVG